jgi:hypothetical protein
MTVFANFRRYLARWILRGWLLDLWLRWKMRRVEWRYARELVRASTNPQPTGTVSALKRGDPMRRVLFISDVQWELNELVPELEKICPVETINLHPRLQKPPRDRLPSEVARQAVQEFIQSHSSCEPDLILLYARSGLLSEALFEAVRRRWSCPLLGMNLDDKLEFLNYGLFSEKRDNYLAWATRFDLNLSNVRAVVDWYADRKLPVCYVPEGYHPKPGLAMPSALPQYQYEIAFVGSKRLEREILVRRLRELGVPVEPIGVGWPNSDGGNHPESVYRATMINLGIGLASPSLHLTTLKTRDFECPGSGSCYLTTYNWELAWHYEIGKEILCYRSIDELVEIFSFFRRRPHTCLEIAQAAYRRCLNEHTWEKRFRKVFREMGFGVV